jgi:hypothetical protein
LEDGRFGIRAIHGRNPKMINRKERKDRETNSFFCVLCLPCGQNFAQNAQLSGTGCGAATEDLQKETKKTK